MHLTFRAANGIFSSVPIKPSPSFDKAEEDLSVLHLNIILPEAHTK
jgi:hypothetical protein